MKKTCLLTCWRKLVMSSRVWRALNKIKKNTDISDKICELMYRKKTLDANDCTFLYLVALRLIAEYESCRDEDGKVSRENMLYIEYAYFIIAWTSVKTESYKALYDFSVNFGYYPLAHKIYETSLNKFETLNQILTEIQIDQYKENGIIKTLEQDKVFNQVLENNHKYISFLAPTSYGKSELIFSHLSNHDVDIVAIIVPTKSLIDQVVRDAKKHVFDRKIISHDQQIDVESKRILAIITQERGMRLLEKGVVFDQVYIDEAQELLEFDYRYGSANRSLILSRFILLNRHLNQNVREIYLSPVVNDSNNLKVKNTDQIHQFKISNNLKLLNIKFLNNQKSLLQYDRFLGKFIELDESYGSNWEYVNEYSKTKNLHFLYRPKFIESYAEKLFANSESVQSIPDDIEVLIQELQILVHPKFKLARYLEKGIVYLHGRIPNNIRNYILKYVRESPYIKHVVSNNVILAGINLPIDNLFYVSGYSKVAELHNLFGRVNRLNEIFKEDNTDISKIFIPIHFIEMKEYKQAGNGVMRNKIEKLRKEFQDSPKNPMLELTEIKKNNIEKSNEIILDEEEIITKYGHLEIKQTLLMIGVQSLLNYSNSAFLTLEKKIEEIKNTDISNLHILTIIQKVFFEGFENEQDFSPDYNVLRLRNKEAVEYYKIFITKYLQQSFRERITGLVTYWKQENTNEYVYVGTPFGEVPFQSNHYKSQNNVYVYLPSHLDDDEYLVNLAIIKLQLDEEFFQHHITVLANALVTLDIITIEQFDEFRYGSSDMLAKELLQSGITPIIANILVKNDQLENIYKDEFGNYLANQNLKSFIQEQTGITKFELEEFFTTYRN